MSDNDSGVRPKIVFAIPRLDAAGPDRVFFELLTGIDRSRYEPILVVSSRGGRYFSMLPDDIRVESIGGGRYPVMRFARVVDRIRPALVFTTLRMNLTAAGARFIQRHRAPLISRPANAIGADFVQLRKRSLVKHRLAQRIVCLSLRIPDVLVAQSQDMAAELARYSKSEQEIITIGNPVSLAATEERRVGEPPASIDSPWGQPAIVAVGRLAPQKGYDILLPAFARLFDTFPNARLTIWGEGPEREALVLQAESLKISDSVRMPGAIEAVFSEVAKADLLVSSSRYEGFSNVILEAMALGTPVVATNCPGATRELILDGQTGILASPIDEGAVYDGMVRALASNRERITAAARFHVESNFGRNKIIRQYSKLFDRYTSTSDRRVPEQ